MALLEKFSHCLREIIQSFFYAIFRKWGCYTELINELDVEALLAEPIEFIKEYKYSENLLDELLNNVISSMTFQMNQPQ